jgi:high-affinity Fe2+/Pb2+ permease
LIKKLEKEKKKKDRKKKKETKNKKRKREPTKKFFRLDFSKKINYHLTRYNRKRTRYRQMSNKHCLKS